MKKRYALLALLVAVLFLSCSLFTPVPDLKWVEVGSAAGPGFANGWGNYGGIYQPCAYALDAQEQLHLVGLVADTSPTEGWGEVLFQLPEGFWPVTLQRAGTTSMAAGFMNSSLGLVTISATGMVTVYPASSNADDLMDLGHVVVKMR